MPINWSAEQSDPAKRALLKARSTVNAQPNQKNRGLAGARAVPEEHGLTLWAKKHHAMPDFDPQDWNPRSLRPTQVERGIIWFSPPYVDKFGNTYQATSVPDVRGDWEALRNKALFDNDFEKFQSLYDSFIRKYGVTPSTHYNDPKETPTKMTFMGTRQKAHPMFREILQRVEQTLKQSEGNSVALLQVRKIANSSNLSNHATGNAVDIDAENNPHIRQPERIELIQSVTGINLGQALTREKLREANILFREGFNDAWVDSQRRKLKQLRSALNGAAKGSGSEVQVLRREEKQLAGLVKTVDRDRKLLTQWSKEGFFNLSDSLIDAFLKADPDVVWGGEYRTSKDFMHFELNPGLRRSLSRKAQR